MSSKGFGSIETVKQIELDLGDRLSKIRLSRNFTQAQLAAESGTSVRTIVRLEGGQGATLDTMIRVLLALRLESNLATFLPDPSVRPIERVKLEGRERQRASGKVATLPASEWTWGDDEA